MDFSVSNRARIVSIVMMAIGVISLVLAYTQLDHDHFWSNLLVNGLFFTFISLGALFFIALQYATEAAWSQMVRRIYEAVTAYLPIGLGVLVVVFLAGTMHWHHIYHWMDPEVMDPESSKYDALIAGKSAYLNIPFFWVRTLVYMAVFIVFRNFFRKRSLREDEEGGTDIHIRNYKRSAIFLVLFAVFSSTLAWDWIMSIDTHWFSTMYGWYTFSGMWVGAMITSLILVLYLKSKGLIPEVNESHIHDMGKWMFAISFLWTYLWFSQFMLIWYSNIPEEVTYFVNRFENYGVPMFAMVIINFVLPMILLMSRDAKRNAKFLITIGTIIFFGHWFDTYLMIIPGVMFDLWHGLALSEIGMMIGFLGLFIFVTLRALSSAKLVPQKSPMIEESLQHHI